MAPSGDVWLDEQFAPHPGVSGEVRQRAVQVFGGHLRGRPLDDAILLVSELVTNALRHASGRIHVRIEGRGDEIYVGVSDPRPDLRPVPRRPGRPSPGGRGLQLVAALARRWGVEDGPGSKTVWCTLPCDERRPTRRGGGGPHVHRSRRPRRAHPSPPTGGPLRPS